MRKIIEMSQAWRIVYFGAEQWSGVELFVGLPDRPAIDAARLLLPKEGNVLKVGPRMEGPTILMDI